MSCNEISSRCSKKTNSACTVYEGTLPSDTSIDANTCEISVEAVLKDMSNILTKISNEINFDQIKQTNFGDPCFTYFNVSSNIGDAPETLSSYVSVREAIKTLENKIIQLMSFVGMPCQSCQDCESCPPIYDQSIACLNLDIPSEDACGNTPATLAQLLQYILNKLP